MSAPSPPPGDGWASSPQELAAARREVSASAPLGQCLTSSVVRTITANALLAIGASPAMVDDVEESGQLAAIASAVLVNRPTPDARSAEAMEPTASAAAEHDRPWVLDPVAVRPLAFPTALAVRLLDRRPTVVRADALVAAAAAHAHVALAAQSARAACSGPGSLAIAWLDALDRTGPDDVAGADVRARG